MLLHKLKVAGAVLLVVLACVGGGTVVFLPMAVAQSVATPEKKDARKGAEDVFPGERTNVFNANRGDEDPPPKEPKALEGKWNLVATEVKGQRAAKVPAAHYVFQPKGKMIWCVEDNPRDDGSYAVDPKKSPNTITITYPEGTHLGIYKIDGDKLTICLTPTGAAEKDRPKEFATTGTDYSLLVFERAKEDKK